MRIRARYNRGGVFAGFDSEPCGIGGIVTEARMVYVSDVRRTHRTCRGSAMVRIATMTALCCR